MLWRLLAFCLIAESLFSAMRVAGFVGRLGGYDAVAVMLILLRGPLAALQFYGGWQLAQRRPQGPPLARAGLATAAVLTIFDVGLGLAPTNVYPWWRMEVTIAYVVYATLGWILLRPRP